MTTQNAIFNPFKITLLALLASLSIASYADSSKKNHEHDHSHNASKQIYRGYFENDQIKDRELTDWQGDWQSAYPYLADGTLAPLMKKKTKSGEKTLQEYTEYYDTGFKTDVNRLVIDGDTVSFYRNDKILSANYASDGYEILTYKKGNRGVRYSFKKVSGDENTPMYIQFSDHHISPAKVDHYHLYWGNDREKVLAELTNWPTYYPSSLSGDDILQRMLGH